MADKKISALSQIADADIESDADIEGDFGASEPAAGGEEPLGRAER